MQEGEGEGEGEGERATVNNAIWQRIARAHITRLHTHTHTRARAHTHITYNTRAQTTHTKSDTKEIVLQLARLVRQHLIL